MSSRTLTDAELEQRRAAPWQHGLRSEFARDGDERVLTDEQRSRLVEIREELESLDGVRDALLDHAAKMMLVFEWGVAWLQDKAEREGVAGAFESKMMARFFTAAAEARRSLESIARLQVRGDDGPSADDVLDALRRERGPG